MRIVSFIMAVLVLVLSCVPCKDDAFIVKSGKARMELSANHNNQGHRDACSPLCHCSCCGSFPITRPSVAVASLIPEYAVNYSSLYTGAVIEVSLPV
ncbi:MAG: DUF6660 family protein, partial [Chitinophaga rupis]